MAEKRGRIARAPRRGRRWFREIGQLAAVAAIRTALNFFLAREIREACGGRALGKTTALMSTIIPIAITCAGFVTLVACALATRNVRTGLQSALELWFAAGAIRLGASASLRSIATAAMILVVRQAVAARFFRRATP